MAMRRSESAQVVGSRRPPQKATRTAQVLDAPKTGAWQLEGVFKDYFDDIIPGLAKVVHAKYQEQITDLHTTVSTQARQISVLQDQIATLRAELKEAKKKETASAWDQRAGDIVSPVTSPKSRPQGRSEQRQQLLAMQSHRASSTLFTGYLDKQKKQGRLVGAGSYQRRYFVLNSRLRILAYFKDEKVVVSRSVSLMHACCFGARGARCACMWTHCPSQTRRDSSRVGLRASV